MYHHHRQIRKVIGMAVRGVSFGRLSFFARISDIR